MLRKPDIDANQQRWLPVFSAFLHEDELVCPSCGKKALEATARCGKDRIGFLLVSCSACGKSGYASRIAFPENLNIQQFEQND